MRKSVFTRACTACFVLTFCLAATIASSAQTLTTLHTFPFSQGNFAPNTPMVQGQDGNFYGTTGLGGDIGQGTSFKLTTQGAFINLDTFCTYSALGCNPLYGGNPHGLILGLDGNFYGFTWDGGPNSDSSVCFSGCGTIFKMTPGGALSLIYGFCAQTGCTDGAQPTSLVQGPDGNFYGTTALAGGSTANCFIGLYDFCGTVFKLTPQGVLTTLHNFCAQKNCADGEYGASLMIASNGNLYGTTLSGGSSAYGVIFQITPAGTYSVLKNFPFGYGPDFNQLIQGSNGDLFGTSNGSNSSSYPGYVFRMTLNGSFSVLHTFCSQPGCADGNTPWNGLVQGTDGSLYGTTREGGANNSKYCSGVGCGTIFSISPQGTFTTLYNFCSQANCADGNSPNGSLIQGTDGKFYGATPNGGNGGTLFSFDVGLGPFIEALPAYGRVGQSTRILGNNLTGTTSVSFNGTPAAFTVIGDTLVTATVPVGATTGPIELTTSIGTLSTNVPFFVRH